MSLTAQPLPSADRPLLGRFNLPCLPLGEPPSPWQHLSLDARRVSVKNDGVFGPLYAGNKLRKLEFLLADAQQRGHDRVATVGAFGSNHALATATWAARLGLRCDVLHFPQPPS